MSRHTLRCCLLAFAFMAMFFFYSRFWRFLAKIIEFKQRGQGFVLSISAYKKLAFLVQWLVAVCIKMSPVLEIKQIEIQQYHHDLKPKKL